MVSGALRAVPAALKAAGIPAAAIAGIGLSGGAHIPVLTDASDRPLRPAIMWSDQRSAAEARELHEQAGDLIIRTSLNRVNPTWTLAMLKWLQRHEPDTIARVRRLYLSKDYLRTRLTGGWETDYSDAVGALMADDRTKSWSAELAGLIGWPMETLPPVVRPTDVVGQVTERAARETGLAAGTPVVCGSNDTTVEFFGVGAVEPGIGAIKIATSAVLFLATQAPASIRRSPAIPISSRGCTTPPPAPIPAPRPIAGCATISSCRRAGPKGGRGQCRLRRDGSPRGGHRRRLRGPHLPSLSAR
jgi:Sugar (pentulose and hexulose) kinases